MQEIPELCLRGKTARSWPNLFRVHPTYLLKDSLDGKRVTAFTPSLLAPSLSTKSTHKSTQVYHKSTKPGVAVEGRRRIHQDRDEGLTTFQLMQRPRRIFA